jgi:hypothetical protein
VTAIIVTASLRGLPLKPIQLVLDFILRSFKPILLQSIKFENWGGNCSIYSLKSEWGCVWVHAQLPMVFYCLKREATDFHTSE